MSLKVEGRIIPEQEWMLGIMESRLVMHREKAWVTLEHGRHKSLDGVFVRQDTKTHVSL